MNSKIIIVMSFLLLFSMNFFAQKKYSLDECKKMAETNNLTLKNSDLEVMSAEQTSKEAYTKYFPKVEASAFSFSNTRSLVSVDLSGIQVNMLKSGTTAGITAIQPIYAGGKITNSNKLSKLGVETSRYQRLVSKNEVLIETEDSFWQLVALVDKQKTLKSVEEQLNSILKKVESSEKVEMSLPNDVLKVKLKINELDAEKSKINNGIALSKMNLCQQMGLPLDSAETFDINIPDFKQIESPLVYFVQHNVAVMDRPEYKLLDKGVEASKIETKIKLSEYLPSVAVGANYGYDNFTKGDHMNGAVFATVSIPISDWWGGSHAMKKQKIQEKVAYNRYEQGKQLLLLEMKQIQNSFEEAYKQVGLSELGITQATENLRLNNNYFKVGTTDITQVLEAESMLAQSKNSYTDACINYYVNKAKYMQATGR
ncbi:MAG: TolC family protein [Bacteroidaceae bacterium]